MGDTYIFLVIGIIFLSIMLWETHRNKILIAEMEKRLDEKEKRLDEIYEALESIVQFTLAEIKDKDTETSSTRMIAVHDNSLRSSALPHEQTNYETIYPLHNDKRKAVILMHKGGSTEEEIAKKLGIGIGEVRLILGLMK
ncbi:MAG: hypothetical protein GX094_02430 [Clostridiales bacterium]|nr:hypothetical protein [Clostridiales bacterium]